MYPFSILPSDPFYPSINYAQHLICVLTNPQCHFDVARNQHSVDPLMFPVYREQWLETQAELFLEYEQHRLLEEQ